MLHVVPTSCEVTMNSPRTPCKRLQWAILIASKTICHWLNGKFCFTMKALQGWGVTQSLAGRLSGGSCLGKYCLQKQHICTAIQKHPTMSLQRNICMIARSHVFCLKPLFLLVQAIINRFRCVTLFQHGNRASAHCYMVCVEPLFLCLLCRHVHQVCSHAHWLMSWGLIGVGAASGQAQTLCSV